MYKVYIIQTEAKWSLRIKKGDQVFRVWQFKRLIEAIEMASALQLHIDNIESLPLNQYSKGA